MAMKKPVSQKTVIEEKTIDDRLSARPTVDSRVPSSGPKATATEEATQFPAESPIHAEIARGGPMASGVARQLQRTKGTEPASVNHANELTGLVDEVRGRLAHLKATTVRPLNSKKEDHQEEDAALELSNQHLNNADEALEAHRRVDQNRNPRAAYTHLVKAGEHIVSAANVLPSQHKKILNDNWAPNGQRWNPEPKENDPFSSSSVSVQNVAKTITGIVKNFGDKYRPKSATVVPAAQPFTEKTVVPVHHGGDSGAGSLDASSNMAKEVDQRANVAFMTSSDKQLQAKRDAAPPRIPKDRPAPLTKDDRAFNRRADRDARLAKPESTPSVFTSPPRNENEDKEAIVAERASPSRPKSVTTGSVGALDHEDTFTKGWDSGTVEVGGYSPTRGTRVSRSSEFGKGQTK